MRKLNANQYEQPVLNTYPSRGIVNSAMPCLAWQFY